MTLIHIFAIHKVRGLRNAGGTRRDDVMGGIHSHLSRICIALCPTRAVKIYSLKRIELNLLKCRGLAKADLKTGN